MSQPKRKTQTDLLPFTAGETVALIALDRIDTAPQVREDFDPEPLAELAADIKARGIMQPITVRQIEEGRFLIVAGERRFRAAGIAGLAVIPALVREMDDATALDMQLAENIQREELTLMETARAIRALYNREKNLAKVAALVSKSKAWVSKHLALTMEDASPFAIDLLRDGKTEDMEILNLVTKVHNDFGGHEAWKMAAQIRAGEMNRTKAREFIKELKAKAEDDADDESESETPTEPNGPRQRQDWEILEGLEEQLRGAISENREPSFQNMASSLPETEREIVRDELAEIFEEGRQAFAHTNERNRTYALMGLGRKCYDNWSKAAAYLGSAGDFEVEDLLREAWILMRTEV